MNRETSATIDNYLFGEMSADTQEEFEQELLENDEMFYNVSERENELVDGFVNGKLVADVEKRFRNSLSQFPARKKKIANAATLQQFIKAERASAPIAEKEPWYRRLGFALRAPAFAAGALGLLLVGMVGLLLLQNRSLNNEIARLNANDANIGELRQREAELQALIEAERSAGSDLTTDLEAERERRAALESELAELRKRIGNSKPPENSSPVVPTIATLILRPSTIRGGPDPVRNLRLENNEKRVALKIYLPSSDSTLERVSVRLNDERLANAVKPISEAGGVRSVTVTAASNQLREGLNRLEVFDEGGTKIASFGIIYSRGSIN